MSRLRASRLLQLCWCVLAWSAAGSAWAVSLGDELILSRLGDPVEVEIEVLQWQDIALDRVQISSASQAEYDVFRLTWLPVLDDLDFNLVGPDVAGKVRVLVSSREPLNEAFLELLLVLRWPGGSLRREYVLLFDPPESTALQRPAPPPDPQALPQPRIATVPQPEPVPVIPQPEPATSVVQTEPEPAAAEPATVPEPAPVVIASATPAARAATAVDIDSSPPPLAPPPGDRRVYRVRSGESLWNIARQFRPAGAGDNLYQMLLAIHNLNRTAFINGNIALLKANSDLQIPGVDDIERIDPLTAESEFDRRWNQGTQRFEAVQRGEPVPLFAEDPPPLAPAEVELPPGVEARPREIAQDELVMVADAGAPQALELAGEALAVPGRDAGAEIAAVDAPVPAMELAPPPQASAQEAYIESRMSDLRTEITAMQQRRVAAQDLARTFGAYLEAARAQRAAQAAPFSRDNVLWAATALVLLVLLIAGIVVALRIAADLRRVTLALSGGEGLEFSGWRAVAISGSGARLGRREPSFGAPAANKPAGSAGSSAPGAVSGDLFARMDDMLSGEARRPDRR